MRSDVILEAYKKKFKDACELPSNTEKEKILFLRHYLSTLNEFLYERRMTEDIDELNKPDDSHPNWKRITPFLAVWDDYAESVLGFKFDRPQINKLAKAFTTIFNNQPSFHVAPSLLAPNDATVTLGGLMPKQFALIRLMHALQDFSRLLPTIDDKLVTNIRQCNNGEIPDERTPASEDGAKSFLAA